MLIGSRQIKKARLNQLILRPLGLCDQAASHMLGILMKRWCHSCRLQDQYLLAYQLQAL